MNLSEIDIAPCMEAQFISVRRWHAGPEWRPRAHAHPFCEIVLVLRGEENIRLAGRQYLCTPGQFMFYPPGCVHEERQSGRAKLEFLCLDFSWPAYPKAAPHLFHDRQGRMKELMRWLHAEVRAGFHEQTPYLEAVTRLLAAEMVRLVERPSDEPLAKVFEYVQEHLCEPITLDDLAACSQLNKFYLGRVFRERTGTTPMEFVRDARLEVAHRLLLETDLPLREIAPRSGFVNEYHLSRLLKDRFGRGARQLRREKTADGDPAE